MAVAVEGAFEGCDAAGDSDVIVEDEFSIGLTHIVGRGGEDIACGYS